MNYAQNFIPDPYKGLMPYSESDRLFFFGRENERKIITDNLKASRLTILYGASGVGKSSVLRAGVAYHLRQAAQENADIEGEPGWAVIVFPPVEGELKDKVSWQEPLKGIKDQLKVEIAGLLNVSLEEIEEQFKKEIANLFKDAPSPPQKISFVDTLRTYTKMISAKRRCGRLFIILDQFEEYFTRISQPDGKDRDFDKDFSAAVNDSSLDVNFLISIREDSLAKLDFFKRSIPNLFNHRLEIKHLDRQSAREAIEKPIAEYNRQSIILDSLLNLRLTVLYGDSNAHKSTLLRDGIVHSLRQPTEQDLDKKERPKLAVILFNDWSKNNDPLVWKFVVRVSLLTNFDKSNKIFASLIFLQDSYPLIKIEQKIEAQVSFSSSQEKNNKVFIILDQFEEYFINQPETSKQQQFIQDLLSVIKYDTNIHFLISIRQDFISELNSFKETIPGECNYLRLLKVKDSRNIDIDRIQEVEPENLDRNNCQQLFQEKFSIEQSLTEKILNDIESLKREEVVIETFLLQLIMDKLWRKEIVELKSHKLREATLTGMGETAKLVNYYLSDKIELLSDSEKDIAASIFHYLVTPDGYKLAQQVSGLLHFANEYRQYRNLPTPQYSQIQDLLNKLSQPDFRILRPLGQERYEIFHDLLGKAILDWQQTFIPKQEMDKITEEIKRLEQEAVEKMLLSEGKRRIVEDLVISTFMYQEDPLKQDEKVALLARQAYLFNQKYRGQMLNEVDEVLRRAVNTPYFSPILRGHEDEVSTVAFSPDSKLFASGSFDGTVRLWDLEQKKSTVLSLDLKSRIKPPPEPGDVLSGGVLSIAFSPDGQTLAVGCGDGTVRLLNPNQPSPKPTVLTGHKGEVWAIAFSPDGKKLASGSWDKTVRLWDLEDLNKTPIILKAHKDWVWSVAFSPNRETLAVGCLDGTVWLWDLHEPIKRWPILSTHEEHLHKLDKKEQQKRAVFSLAFCRDKDGKDCLAASCNDGKVRSWDLNQLDTVPKDAKEDTKNPKVLVSKENMLRAVMAFSRNEQSLALESLAVGFDDGTISLWKRDLLNVDLNVVVVEKYSLKGHSRGVSSLAFSPDGQWLVSGSWGKDSNWDNDTTVRLWDLRPPAAEPIILQEHGDKVVTVAFSPDGKMLASGSYDQTTRLWDLSRLVKEPISLKDHEEGNINSVAFSPAGRMIASGNAQGEVRLWDIHDRNKVFQPLYDCGQEVSSVAFRPPDGKILAAGSHGNKVLLWDLSNPDRPNPLPSLEGHKDRVSAVAFSPDGKILASGSRDRTVRLWHLNNQDAPPIPLPPFEGAVSSLAFSPERQGEPQMLAVATDKQTIQLWDVSPLQESPDAEPVFSSEYASFKGLSVAFSPDGQILASGTQKGVVWLWDLRQPDVDPIVLEGHTQAVRTLAFSPDGQWLASGSDDKTIRLWIYKTETIADMVCQKVWRNLTQVEWNEFVGESIPYELTCANLPPGEGVLADERIDILKREFDYKLSRLLEGQKSLLELITEQKREMSEEEIATALRKPKLDEGALARLSALCRLGFIFKNSTDLSSIKYSLSPRYLRYLQNI